MLRGPIRTAGSVSLGTAQGRRELLLSERCPLTSAAAAAAYSRPRGALATSGLLARNAQGRTAAVQQGTGEGLRGAPRAVSR